MLLNARGSVRNIWGLYAADGSPNPEAVLLLLLLPIGAPLQSSAVLTRWSSSSFQEVHYSKRRHLWVLLTIHISAFTFSSVFTWTILHQVFFFVKQMLLDSNACISEGFFSFVYLLRCLLSLVTYLFFFFPFWGGKNLITIQHKLKNRTTHLFIYFGFDGSRSSLGSFVSFACCKRRESGEKTSGPAPRWLHYFGCWSSKCRRLWAVVALAAQSACYTHCSAKSICTHTHTAWKSAEFGRRKKPHTSHACVVVSYITL